VRYRLDHMEDRRALVSWWVPPLGRWAAIMGAAGGREPMEAAGFGYSLLDLDRADPFPVGSAATS
jgi:hypothetical protein